MPANMLTSYESSGDNVHSNQRLGDCLIFPYPWTLPIRIMQFGTAFAYHVPQHAQVYGPIIGGQLVSAHSE